MEDKLLISYLDAINFNIHDNDLILLNQMATIKSLVNRKSFSISDKQISMIHKKFLNIYHQRLSHNGGALILDDEEDRPKSHHGFEAKKAPSLPKELEYHELEESREYRHAQDLERSRSRSGVRRPGSRTRKHEDSYIGRGSHHAGSFIASPAQPKHQSRRNQSPGRSDRGMDELQDFLNNKPTKHIEQIMSNSK